MSRQLYTNKLLEHYESPRHYGPMSNADAVVTGNHPGCRDEITIYLKVVNGSRAKKIQFEGKGCTLSQGAASILLDAVQNRPLAEIEAIDYNALLDMLGRDIILNRISCATLALDTLKAAIQQFYTHHQGNGAAG